MHTELVEHPLPNQEMLERTRPEGFKKVGADETHMIIDYTEFVVEMGNEPFL